ncbi:MAG: DUF669 domain-containing protein [Bryobacteraceae bacterium]|nr:DUF669 domain-containing protein [Bryobacteraceae bacterium]
MTKKLILGFATFALAVASAANYKVTLFQPSMLEGKELKPGEYKVTVTDSKATISKGKESVEANVKVETADEKFSSTSVRYQNGDGKYRIREIRIGGTTTKLVFN